MLPFKESLIIIPTYNENENVSKMIETLLSLYPEINLLIIDDGSPDGTANTVKDLIANFPNNLNLIERSGKQGLATAYITGFKWGLDNGYNYIFEMDCDFSHSPDDVPRLLEAAQSNDLVIGSRYIDGIRIINWPFHRLLLSYGASIYTRLVTGMPILDPTGGFKCFTRRTLEKIDFDRVFSKGYIFQVELNFKAWSKKLKVKEVPIIFTERRNGHSKMTESIIFEAVLSVLKLRFLKIIGKI